jgi:hypothetical protein
MGGGGGAKLRQLAVGKEPHHESYKYVGMALSTLLQKLWDLPMQHKIFTG